MNNSKKLYDPRGNDKNHHKVASINLTFFVCEDPWKNTDFFQIFKTTFSGCTSASKFQKMCENGIFSDPDENSYFLW